MKTHSDRKALPRQHRSAAHAEPGHRPGGPAGQASPRDALQRRRIDSAFGATTQLAGPEDELQMRADPAVQLAGPEDEPLQGRFEAGAVQRAGPEEELQMKADPAVQLAGPEEELQMKAEPNRTGMPDGLKSGIESLSGMSMSDVRVHANSSEPAQLNALAYAQGNDIHMAPGQEQHLPHEAWHVVQQRQGRVQPTMQMAGVEVNDAASLESEADAMGA